MRQIAFVAVLLLCGCAGQPQDERRGPQTEALQDAIDRTMAEARRAIDQFGETDEAMASIQAALADLGLQAGLKERAELTELHGSPSMAAAVLASEGDDGITLLLVRFLADTSTPVHDHLTWGVVHVLEGRDRYIQWERQDVGTSPDRADLQVKSDQTLESGQSVYWLGPPQDIHSQAALDSDVWELVLAGKNLIAEVVTHHRHYYDPETGRMRKAQ